MILFVEQGNQRNFVTLRSPLFLPLVCCCFFLGAKVSGSKYPFLEKLNSVTNVAKLNTVFSPIFEGSCCYCALPFNSSRHNTVALLANFVWVYWRIVVFCIDNKYMFNVFLMFFFAITTLPKNWQQQIRHNFWRYSVWSKTDIVFIVFIKSCWLVRVAFKNLEKPWKTLNSK